MLNNLKRFWITIKLVSNPRKPLAFLALTKSFIKARVFKRPVLRGVDIVTNYSCNLVCQHCNITPMMKDKSLELNYEDYRNIERQCSELGVFEYTFTGGEPLLRKDFAHILKIFKPYKRVVIVQTNAQPIKNLEKAKWLKEIGVDIVNVSLDSGIANEHDTNRGLQNHFEQTVRALDLCREAGLKTMVGTVISHHNIHSEGIKKLLDYVRETGTILILNLAAPLGRWYNNKEILLTEKDQKDVRRMVKENPYARLDMDSTLRQYGCPGFKEKMYITPYGDVTGCTFVQVSFGNIRDKSIKEIRELAIKSEFMNEFSPKCYCAEDSGFIEKYMSQLGDEVPKDYKEVIK